MIKTNDKNIITFCYASPKPTTHDLHSVHKKPMAWTFKNKLTDNRLTFTGEFMVQADIKKHFPSKENQISGSYEKNQYGPFTLHVDITQLFKLKLSSAHDRAIIVSKTINASTWIKNHDLRVYLKMYVDDSKPKKRKIQNNFYVGIVEDKRKVKEN